MGLPAPSFRCGLALRGAGAQRNSTSAPDAAKQGHIDVTCDAADSCTGSAAGCAQPPRRCRGRLLHVVRRAVIRCNLRSSVATAAGRPLGIRSQRPASITSQARSDLFVLEYSVLAEEVRCSVPLRAVAPIGMWALPTTAGIQESARARIRRPLASAIVCSRRESQVKTRASSCCAFYSQD
jgi:hypothetical protein